MREIAPAHLQWMGDSAKLLVLGPAPGRIKIMEAKNMDLFETLVETLKKNPKKIVFTEGTDARILSATDRLVKAATS